MSVETVAVERWIYGALLAAGITEIGTSRIYGYVAPNDAPMPFVVFQHQASRDIRGVGTARIMVDCMYVVKAVDETGRFTGTLSAVAEAIDAALHAKSGTLGPEGIVLHCVREEPFALFEIDDGREYRHLGGLYRIWAQAA